MLVLFGAAAAFRAAFLPHMTESSVASKLAEANHPVACPPQWLPVILAANAPVATTNGRRLFANVFATKAELKTALVANENASPMASLVKDEGAVLAEGIWHFKHFLTPAQVTHFLDMANDPSLEWRPCVGSKGTHAKEKLCSIIHVEDDDKLTFEFLAKLGLLWGVNMTHMNRGLPIVWSPPGSGATAPHVDMYEGNPPRVFDVSNVIYLTDVPPKTSRNRFDKLGVAVQPSPGALLSWRNTDSLGKVRGEAVHHVEPLPADAEARIAMQIPITLLKSFAFTEELGTAAKSSADARCALPLFAQQGFAQPQDEDRHNIVQLDNSGRKHACNHMRNPACSRMRSIPHVTVSSPACSRMDSRQGSAQDLRAGGHVRRGLGVEPRQLERVRRRARRGEAHYAGCARQADPLLGGGKF